MSIEIANESGAEVDETVLVAAARFALDRMRVSPLAELSVLLVTRDVMVDLHHRWMGLPGPTDVLAFPMDDLSETTTRAGRPDSPPPGPTLLGDVVLCPAAASEGASSAGHTLTDELALLAVHGVLHVLGYDHAEPAEERQMFALQDGILTDFWQAGRAAARRAAQREADSRVLGTVGLDGPECPGPAR